MSLACCVPVLECVYCIGCVRWVWYRCLHKAEHDSENWGLATAGEFKPVPHLCRLILSVYEDDLDHPQWAPPGGYKINPRWVHHKNSDTNNKAPTYLLYIDHENKDLILAIRGLNLAREREYAVLLDNKLGERNFDGGYVHNGLLKCAEWVFEEERETLRDILGTHRDYSLTFTGHSLGSGVAALLAILAVQNRGILGISQRERIRCFAMAPPRCVSLNLAVRYADVINSVVLQVISQLHCDGKQTVLRIFVYHHNAVGLPFIMVIDDFLPRTATSLQDLVKFLFCLPCLLCIRCMMDTCIPENIMLRDPRRLYAPGRLYHIIERKPYRCGRYPPVVKTAVPVDGRFERIVLSCNAISDHAIIWMQRESQIALDLMIEKEGITNEPPLTQRMDKRISHIEEQNLAIQRINALHVPNSNISYKYGTFDDNYNDNNYNCINNEETSTSSSTIWDNWIVRVFKNDESGKLVPR